MAAVPSSLRSAALWKVVGWLVTFAVALAALGISKRTADAGESTRILADQQRQELDEIRRLTPTAQITLVTKYKAEESDRDSIRDVHSYPILPQQVVDISGTAENVPDNGELFVMVHEYGGRERDTLVESRSKYFPSKVDLTFGTSVQNQVWRSPGVPIGPASAPPEVTSYRVSLYFCSSRDAADISSFLEHGDRSKGLLALAYPGCRQLDSIFVRREAR